MSENALGNYFGAATGDLYLSRTGKDKDGYEMGQLMIPSIGKIFTTRERGHRYVSLRIGKYQMKHSIKKEGRKVNCLRPKESSITTILIHDADKDNPKTLEGCIAPGLMGGGANWHDSAQAMKELWSCLGGFEAEKEVTLHVLTNVSYIPAEQTRDEWGRTK